ncbi:MAG: gamma-glutamylcyclotransferase [Acidiferrobacterales bacterium]|nr:gamma-glutamylcyclotransferase [Acidiferrobacterales bacterium]
MQRLFVYGTLAPNQENHYLLEDIIGQWQTATLKGWERDQQWERYSGYPGIKRSNKNSTVNGHLLSSETLSEYWPRLDEFEGSEYQRVIVNVGLENGDFVKAYAYRIRRSGQ